MTDVFTQQVVALIHDFTYPSRLFDTFTQEYLPTQRACVVTICGKRRAENQHELWGRHDLSDWLASRQIVSVTHNSSGVGRVVLWVMAVCVQSVDIISFLIVVEDLVYVWPLP